MQMPDTKCPRHSSDYAPLRMRWTVIAASGELLFLTGVLAFDSRIAPVLETSSSWANRPAAYAALLAGAATAGYLAVMLPIQYHRLYRLRRNFGLSNETPLHAFIRIGRGVLLGAVVAIMALLVILISRRYLGPFWPAAPIILLAIWFGISLWRKPGRLVGYKTQPLDETARGEELIRFAQTQGIENLQLYCLRASALGREATAVYLPVRGKPCVYLSDNLPALLTGRQMVAIVAHELGHRIKKHALIQVGLGFASELVVLGCIYLILPVLADDATSLWQATHAAPTILLSTWLVCFFLRPMFLAIIRRNERQANAWALQATGDPAAFILAMKKLAKNNLATGRPGWWERLFFASHPSPDEIVDQARRYAAEHGIELSDHDIELNT